MARLLRSSTFVGMVVPLSSHLAAAEEGSATDRLHTKISQEEMDDLMTYLSSLRGPVMPEGGGGAAEVLLLAAPRGGRRGTSVLDNSWEWFNRFGVSGPQQRGTLCPLGGGLAITLDGNVVKGFTPFGGSFRGALMGGCFTGIPPTEEEKRSFQYQQFELQRKLFDASSRIAFLKLMQIVADSEASVNESNMRTVEEKSAFLEKGQQQLKEKMDVYERRLAEEKKLEEILVILKEMAASGARTAQLESEITSSSHYDLKPPQSACTSTKGRVEQLLFGLRRVDKSYLTFMKFYPILLGAFVWYTSGVEPGEIVHYMEASRVKNKEEVKILLSDFQKQRDEKNTSVSCVQDDKTAIVQEASKEDDPAGKPKEDGPAAKGDEPAPKKGRWYLLGY